MLCAHLVKEQEDEFRHTLDNFPHPTTAPGLLMLLASPEGYGIKNCPKAESYLLLVAPGLLEIPEGGL